MKKERLTIYLPPKLITKLRVEAAKRRKPLSALVEDAIKEWERRRK